MNHAKTEYIRNYCFSDKHLVKRQGPEEDLCKGGSEDQVPRSRYARAAAGLPESDTATLEMLYTSVVLLPTSQRLTRSSDSLDVSLSVAAISQ